ncbi:TMV resistance protein N [Morella rubra]|uniref:TMV resistance protein N n=1 Tax=Morella rubra TaxID=262757 RepID=A0A6A1WRX9_9ROSI|nr:TMV resistance protein N [Morella rubra]
MEGSESGCRSLIKTPDFTKVPSLEILSLSNCRSLSQVHQSIGVLKRLKELDLSNCEKLKSLPDLISLKSLEQIDLRHCLELEKFPEIVGNLTSLWWPDLEETLLKELPSSDPFRVSCLWFNNSPGEFAYSGRIRHGSEEIICRGTFWKGCVSITTVKKVAISCTLVWAIRAWTVLSNSREFIDAGM